MKSKELKNGEKENSNLGANSLKIVGYGYHKKNEFLEKMLASPPTKSYPSLSIRAMPHLFNFASNFLEDKSRSVGGATVNTLFDAAADKALGAGPMLAIEAVGQVADVACTRLESKIKHIEMQPGWHPELEVLQEGQVIWGALRLPKKALGYVKDTAKELAFDLYDFLKKPKARETAQETHLLLNKLAPHATQSMSQYSDYVLTHLAQSKKDISSLQDVLQNPAFQDVLQKLKLSQQLTQNQTGLLTLYAAGQYAGYSSPKTYAALPDTQSLQKDLAHLESAIRLDLAQKKPSDSLIFSEIHHVTASHLKLLAPNSTANSLFTEIPKEKLVLATRFQDAGYKVHACSNLLGQVVALTGNHKIAGKITAIGGGTSLLLGGAAMLATGNIFGGIVGIGQGICSFFSGLFGDDDDDGDDSLSIVSQQIHNVHEDMIEGFNQVLLQQTALARGLSSQLLSLGQAAMVRFDHVDEQLQRIDAHLMEAYKQLMTQQQYLGQQIHHLSQQLTQTERNIFNGLQQVHNNLVQSIHKMGTQLSKGLVALSDQLDSRFLMLDQNLHKTAQELNLRMAQNRLNQTHFFNQIQSDLESHRALLLTQNQQSHAIQKDHFIQQSTQYQERQRTLKEQHSTYAKRFLQSESLVKVRMDKLYLHPDLQINNLLTGGAIDLSPEVICKALGKPSQWIERDPFDYINLLRRHVMSLDPQAASSPVLQKNLIHFPVWYKNCEAWIKGTLTQEHIEAPFWAELEHQASKARGIVLFSDYCAQPKVLTALFTQCAKNTEKLSHWLLQKQQQHQQTLHLNLQANLVARLQQSRLEWEQFKISDSTQNQKQMSDLFEARMNEIKALSLDFLTENPGTLSKPAQYFLPVTVDQKTILLPLLDKQLPPIPHYCFALEQFDLGHVNCYGHYETKDRQLHLTLEFKAKGQKSVFILAKQTLSIDPHLHPLLQDCIQDAWQKVTWLDSEPKAEDETLLTIYNTACAQFRLTLNSKTQQDFLAPAAQHLTKSLDASSGILHLTLKLLFESSYQAGHSILPDILTSCVNSDQLQHLFENYQGEHPHFLTSFSQLDSGHQFLLTHFLDLMEKKQIYVENLRLNNALLFLDNLTLNHLSTKEKINWLNKAVTMFPESAIMHLLYGMLLAGTNAVDTALIHLEKAQHLKPDDNQIRLCYAACLQQAGNYPKAIQEFGSIIQQLHQALEQTTDEAITKPLALSLITVFMQRGNAFFKAEYFAAALADYEKAILLQVDNPDLLYKQAYTLECLGYTEKARTIYQDILKLNHQHHFGMEGLARCLKESNPHQALAYYQELLNQFPLTGLKMQCALLSLKINPASKTGKDWLLEVAQDRHASKEDLLLCCELSFRLDCINTTRLAFSFVKDNLNTQEDFRRGAVVANNLNNISLWASFTRKYKLAPQGVNALPRELLKECSSDALKPGLRIKSDTSPSFFNQKRLAKSNTGVNSLENTL